MPWVSLWCKTGGKKNNTYIPAGHFISHNMTMLTWNIKFSEGLILSTWHCPATRRRWGKRAQQSSDRRLARWSELSWNIGWNHLTPISGWLFAQTCPGKVSRPRVSRPCPWLPTLQRSWKGFCNCAVITHTICHSPFLPWTWWLREWQSTRRGRERQRWRSTKSREWGGRFSQTWGTSLWLRYGLKISYRSAWKC